MRIARIARPEGPRYGLVVAPLDRPPHVTLIEGDPFDAFDVTEESFPLDAVTLLPPVAPRTILGIGRNYAAHAAEMGGEAHREPLVFAKLTSSVIGPGEPIRLPPESADVHHEAELAIVIGRTIRRASREAAAAAVFGYTLANDVTARDLQRHDGQFTRAKGFDTFCPLGPWIATDLDPASGLAVRCRVDGTLRQNGSTADMVHDVAAVIEHCSAFATLVPGDVVLTGTPAGVGPLRAGQRCEIEVEGIGTLTNPVVAEGR